MAITVRFSGIMYLAAVCVIILNTAVIGAAHHRSPERHVALFVFGDSLFDPGNNNYIRTTTEYQANFWPYGETFFSYPTGRFSDGRIIPDFISEYAKLPLIPPYLEAGVDDYEYGVNFASGGAGALVESHQGFVVDLKTQLRYFAKVEEQLRRKSGAGEAKELISSAVYLFSVGSNDYSSYTFDSKYFYNNYSRKEYVAMVIGNLTQVIQGIYKIGGRKFGFVSLPPMGCLPGTKVHQPRSTSSCFEESNSLAKLHNRELSRTLQALESQLEGFKYSKHDLYTSFNERMADPTKYGFKEANVACCGIGEFRGIISCGRKGEVKEFELCDDPRDYFFFDSVHPSEEANKQLAKLIWSGDSDITKPYNIYQLFEF